MKGSAAPFFRGDIGDSFRKVPPVATKILSVILALAIGVIRRLGQDNRSVPPRAFAVLLAVFDSNLDDVGVIRHAVAFSYGETTVPRFHLDTVVGYA